MAQAESKLSRLIRGALNARGHRVWKNWGSRFSERGLSDITGASRHGIAITLEVKMPGKEFSGLSAAQKRFLRSVVKASPLSIVAVVTSVTEAIKCVEENGLFAKVYSDGFCYMVPASKLTGDEADIVVEALRARGEWNWQDLP